VKRFQVLLIALLACCAPFAHSTTYTVNSGQSTATIQGVINGTAAGDTVSFSAGTYSITAGVTLKCGVTYTGPVANPATAILASTFGQSGAIFKLFTGGGFANPCTQKTTIEYFDLKNSGGVYVQTSFTNLDIVHNQFSNIPCCNSAEPATTGIWFDGAQSTSNTAQILSNTLVQWNTVGDSASCLSPASAFADTSSPEGDGDAGSCNGMIVATSVNGLTVKNNNFFHVSEGIHITCPGGGHPGTTQPCEPTSNGVTTKNVDIEFNEFNKNHRINFEEQPQTITGVIFRHNSIHDMLNPTAFSFGLSFACCGGGAVSPFLNVSDNVLVLNVAPVGRYGYGIEAWGKNANYDNNFVESGAGATSIGMAYSFGPVATMNFNKICGAGFAAAGYIASEGNGSGIIPPAQTGNVNSPTCSAAVSAPPSIFPASGATPLTITLSDPGLTSGAGPRDNTSIWYTTDGTTPVPGQGTTQFYTGPFTLNTSTVKAVGMWGALNQPLSYPSGYGFVPSSVVTSTFTSAAAAATPVFSPGSSSFATSLNVSISDATAGATIYYTLDGSTPTTSSTVYSGPIAVSGASTVLKAIATHTGNSQSATATATYISTTVVSTPTFSPGTSTFSGSVSASISDLTPSSTIYYTTDGTTPTTGGGSGGGGLVRGRVHVSGGSVLSDDGQPLRFATARLRASEWGPYGSQQSWWQKMHDTGKFNGVRIMAGFSTCTPSCTFTATQLQAMLDAAVANASATGMYVMIDDHDECCASQNLATDTSFWNAIAPRYKNNTNVIYEAKNEPDYFDTTTNYGASGTGYPGYETAIYNVIRSQAPNTHIVMWSTSQPYDVSQATELGWYSTASTISYANASVGVHPYNMVSGNGGCTSTTSCAPYIARLSAVQTAGYPVIMTELITLISGAPDQQLLSALDGIGVSWTWYDYTGVWTTGSGPCSSANTCGNPHNEAMSIYWTQDPNIGANVYTGPFTVSATTTVKALATASGLTDSAVGMATYTLGGAAVTSTPSATPGAGSYFATQSVTLIDSTAGATICYTTDGSTPSAFTPGTCSAGTIYSGAITVSSSETINAIGTMSGLSNSPVASFAYVISAPTPTDRGNIDYTQIKSLERLGPGNLFQMANKGTYSAVSTATPCNSTNAGGTAFVTDSMTTTYGASISGGGSNKVHALCNGTAWVVD
jgi:hypothetical protein